MTGGRRQQRLPGRAFVISGPSGGGKTTVVQEVVKRLPRLSRSVSITTRPPRRGERAGKDYQFVTPKRFKQKVRAKQLLEWAKVHDAYYGTPRRPVMEALARGRDVILSIDVQGARQIRRRLGRRARLIFLMPPSAKQLHQRLRRRKTDSPSAIARRLAAARREIACAGWYDHVVINDKLKHAVSQVRQLISLRGDGKHKT